jgi:hypothetical protein
MALPVGATTIETGLRSRIGLLPPPSFHQLTNKLDFNHNVGFSKELQAYIALSAVSI